MINNDVVTFFKSLCNNHEIKDEFEQISGKSFVLSRNRNSVIVNKSNGLLTKTKLDKTTTRRQEYFKDKYGNCYDLRVGKNKNNTDQAGSINIRDILSFGYGDDAENHYFICINEQLNKLYFINAKELFEIKNSLSWRLGEQGEAFIGEDSYKSKYTSLI